MAPATTPLPSSTRVLVVGAGPVGLTTGIVLRHHGHEVTLVDAQRGAAGTSRAAVVHARVLEVLQPYGVTEPLVEQGVHTDRFTDRDRDRALAALPFQDLPTDYPYALMISQADTEAVLLSRFEELGGTVLRPVTVEQVQQGADHVTVVCQDGQQLRAEHVVGADGMHSRVREQAGIGFGGGTHAESFSLADVRLGGGFWDEEVALYFSPAGMLVLAPLPGGWHRVVAAVEQAPERPDVAFVQRLLDARGPHRVPATVHEVVWGSRFRVHHRIADTYRVGRVLLAGDSAHVHSPAGGQGMNLGVDDAVSLGEALVQVLDGAPDDVLDAYASARRPLAQQVVRLAGRLTTLATAPPALRPWRNAGLSVVGRVPAVRARLAAQLAGLDRRPGGAGGGASASADAGR